MAESLEVRALRQYALDARLSHRVTSTYRKSTRSRHGAQGTDGVGLAVDFAGPVPDEDGSPEMMAIAEAFLDLRPALFELIYTPLGFSIKRGRRVAPLRAADHYDHVHVAVDRGVLVRYPEESMPDDPNAPNLAGPVMIQLLMNSEGECTGYAILSTTTGDLHGFGPGWKFYGRSEVLASK